MTRAQERLATLVEWVKQSSKDSMAPLGKDRIVYGPYAVFVPQALNLPPEPMFAPEHLPLWIPEQQATPDLPPFNQDTPLMRGPMDSRLQHIVWKWMDGWFPGALLALTDPAEPLQGVLDRQLPGLDLDDCPAIFLPVWQLRGNDLRAWGLRQLPLVRGL